MPILIGLAAFVSTLMTRLPAATIEYIAPPAQAYFPVAPNKTIVEKINAVAEEKGIASSTLRNIVKTESLFNAAAVGDNGLARGAVQIRSDYHPEVSDAQAFDPDFALNWAADVIKQGTEDTTFTECSCVSYLRSIGVTLPHASFNASDMASSSNTYAHVGAVVLFHYPSGEYHLAYIKAIGPQGDLLVTEANYVHCTIDTRLVALTDPSIIGYWDAGTTP